MAEPHELYALRYGVDFTSRLGKGKDGYVLETSEHHAVKFLNLREIYEREAKAYELLRELEIEEVEGFQIPLLIRVDPVLMAIEMTIVQPPFVLDFASAYTEEENFFFDFPDDVINEREQHWQEIFGERWAKVVSLRDEFTRLTGLVLLDLSLNNVRFE